MQDEILITLTDRMIRNRVPPEIIRKILIEYHGLSKMRARILVGTRLLSFGRWIKRREKGKTWTW